MRQPVKRKRRQKARFLSALMAVVLLATTVPSSSFAQQTDENTGAVETEVESAASSDTDKTENSGQNAQSEPSEQPVSEENVSEPASEENVSEPVSEENASEPTSGENASGSGSEENMSEPTSEENTSEVPSDEDSVPPSDENVETPSSTETESPVESITSSEESDSMQNGEEADQSGQNDAALSLQVNASEGAAEAVIYWVTEEGEAAERPAADEFTGYKLYFSIDGGEAVELTSSSKEEVGVVDLPAISKEDSGDGCGYRLYVENLPSEIQYVSPETEAAEGLDQQEDGDPQTVSWKIVPQDELTGFTLHEVSDPEGVSYASKGAGWYYVKEAEEPSAPAEETEDETTVTGWRESYSKTVFWADNQNEEKVRPSVEDYPLPKLYFTYTVTETGGETDAGQTDDALENGESEGNMEGSAKADSSGSAEVSEETPDADTGSARTAGETDDGAKMETVSGVELTEENMEQIGLTAMPEIEIADNGDSYTLNISGNALPASFERTKDGVRGTGSVEWEIVLQDVDGYELVEVTEEDLSGYPDEFFYAESAGTYYVIEGLEAEKEEETLEITGWAEESRSTVYWVDYNDGFGIRPDGVTPELYFTISRKDGQAEEGTGERLQLTEENLSKLGLESMPEFRMENKGTAQKDGEELWLVIEGAGGEPVPFTVDVYEVILDRESLPAALTRTVGEEKTEYAVEWEILPGEVGDYTLVEVTEENLAQMREEHPYVTEAGWYYVLENGEIGVYAESEIQVDQTGTLKQLIFWRDNGNESNARVSNKDYQDSQSPVLTYKMTQVDENGQKIEGGMEMTGSGTVDDLDWFGIFGLNAEEEDTIPAISVDDNGNHSYTLSVNDLPEKVTETFALENVYWDVEWSIEPDQNVPAGYELINVTDANKGEFENFVQESGWYYMKTEPFTFEIVFHTGGTDEESIKEALEQIMDDFKFYGETPNQNHWGETNLADDINGVLDFTYTIEGNTVKLTSAPIRKYYLDGSQITYRVEKPAGLGDSNQLGSLPGIDMETEEGDYLEITFDNTKVPNQSGNTSYAYSGGQMLLTLKGTEQYEATKVWLDTDASKRPGGEYQLWRFREGEDYTTASRVMGDAYKQAVEGASAEYDEETGHDVERISLPQASGTVNSLPKYDAEGYRYIYVVREYLDSTTESGETANSYTQIFGSVDENGNVSGDVVETYQDGTTDRKSGDNNLYNGGTLSNRVAGTVETDVTKIWKASAFQAELSGVSIELTLQCRHKDSDEEWTEAKDSSGNTIVRTMDDFKAELLAGKTINYTAQRYDALGNELEYRWVESGVYQDGGSNLFQNSDGSIRVEDYTLGGTFTLTQDNGRPVEYGSWYRDTSQNETSYSSEIRNTIRNDVEYEVEKKWVNMEPQEVTFLLYRSTSEGTTPGKFIQITLGTDGLVKESSMIVDESQLIFGENISYSQDTPWNFTFEGLMEYDNEGRKYEYFLLEKSGNPDYETIRTGEYGENYKTTVTNGPGPGNKIMVRKRWIDDGDDLHRENVKIGVFNRTTNELLETVELGDNIWYKIIGIGTLTAEDVYILELQMGDIVPVDEDGDGRYDPDEIRDPAGKDPVLFQGNPHRYEITYAQRYMPEAEITAFIAINRRLGGIDLEVTKEWTDGSGEKREEMLKAIEDMPEDKKLTLNLRLKFADSIDAAASGYEISYQRDWVKLANEEVKVDTVQEISLEPEENDYADTQIFEFFNLPKYDASGASVLYTIEEVWLDSAGHVVTLEEMKGNPDYEDLYNIVKDMSTQITEISYTPHHDENDEQEIQVTNKMSGSKTVMWHKEWNDEYAYQNNLRPDIYLDIYKLVHDAEGKEILELERADYRWVYEEVPGEETSEEKQWIAVIPGLAKYDSNGYEITYYAVENTSGDPSQFEYLEVDYWYGKDRLGSESDIKDPDKVNEEGMRYVQNISEAADSPRYALIENGTFSNRIQAPISIAGQKIWENIPSGFASDDFPDITVELYRTTDGTTENGTRVAEVELDHYTAVQTNNKFAIQYYGKNSVSMDAGGNLVVEYLGPLTDTGESSEKVENDPDSGEAETGKLLEKYDENGRLYTYYVKERIKWPDNADENGGGLYQEMETATGNNNYTLTNSYDSEKGIISAKKLLYLDAGTVNFPAVTFQLYRQYQRKDGSYSSWVPVDNKQQVVWSAEEVEDAFNTAKGADGNAEGYWLEWSVDFGEQEVYAPNGTKYRYQVREIKTSLGAYDTWMVMEDIEKKNAESYIADETHKPVTPEKDTEQSTIYVASDENHPIVMSKAAQGGSGTGQEENTYTQSQKVTFLNKRADEEGIELLSGGKVWEDLDNIYEFRPGTVEAEDWFTLYRYTQTQPGGSAIQEEEVPEGSYKLELAIDNSDTNRWTIIITATDGHTLERYADNDMPWIYRIKESLPVGSEYKASPNATNEGKNAYADETISNGEPSGTIADLTNSILTSKHFTKEWVDENGNPITGDYLGYYLKVTFKLQVSDDGGVSWEDAEDYFLDKDGLKDYTFEKALSGYITDETWANGESFTGLPTVITTEDKEKVTLTWRVVESEIQYGSEDDINNNNGSKIVVNVASTSSEGTPQEGVTIPKDAVIYTESDGIISPDYAEENEDTSVHRNIVRSTGFTINKIWENDEKNAYGTRPITDEPGQSWESCFVIKRSTNENDMGSVKEGGLVHRYVNGEDSGPLVVYITGENARPEGAQYDGTITINGLPGENKDGDTYYYWALELDPEIYKSEGIEAAIRSGEENQYYHDSYTVEYQHDLNATTVTNSLDYIDFSVEKVWNLGEGISPVPVTIRLQYQTVNGGWEDVGSLRIDGNEDDDPQNPWYELKKGEDGVWRAVFNHVPKRYPNSLKENNETVYQIIEEFPDGIVQVSTTAGTEGSYTFTNSAETSLTIRKDWLVEDQNETADSITVGIYRTTVEDPEKWTPENNEYKPDGTEQKTVELTKKGNWTLTISDLPKYSEAGERYYYFAKELDEDGKPMEGDVAENGETVIRVTYENTTDDSSTSTQIYNIGFTDVQGTKTWIDNSNAYQTRPENLELTLYRTTSENAELPEKLSSAEPEKWEKLGWKIVEKAPEPTWEETETDQWTFTYRNLPLADDEGNLYTYAVKEAVPEVAQKPAEDELSWTNGDRYEETRDEEKGSELNLINTLTGKLDITVEKVWRDHNAEGRPDEITIVLKGTGSGSGKETDHSYTLKPNVADQLIETLLRTDTATWSHKFKDLPKYEMYEGQPYRIIYTVEEIILKDDGYDVKIDHKVDPKDNNHYIFTITNTKQGSLTVTKTVSGGNGDVWKDWRFTVTLSDKTVNGTYGEMTFKDGVASFTLKHGQTKTAEGLPGGITYTVSEEEANQNGYTTTASGASGTIPIGGTAEAAFTNHNDPEEEHHDDDDTPPTTVSANAVPPVSALPLIPWITGVINAAGGGGVQTGDMASPLLYIGLAVLALAVIIIVLIAGKKRGKKKDASGQNDRKRSRRKNKK